MTIQLLRDTRLWVSVAKKGETITPTNTWEVLIQDDFAFNQDSSSTDVNLDEGGPRPTRGSKRFNESLNPADWNFSTYLRPYTDAKSGKVLTPDFVLWHALASGAGLDLTSSSGVSNNETNMLVNFSDNQHHELLKINLFYLTDNVWYKIHDVQVGQAEISVDISDIGMTAWSGQGTLVEPLGVTAPFNHTDESFSFPDAVFESASWIKNKLTTLLVKDNKDNTTYDIPITGASITINNNISYLTPNTLSRLDVPIGSFTGTFDVSGSLEAYLRSRDSGDKQDKAAELLSKMISDRSITNSFEVAICLGGRYPNEYNSNITSAPGVVIVLPTAHLSVPSTETADVLGTSIEFKGIPTDLSAGDEVFIGMSPDYTSDEITKLVSTGDGHTVT